MQQVEVTGKSFTWNIIGSMFNAGASLILLLFVTRTVGDSNAGVFSLAFASAQLFLTVGRYGMRAYQSTDLKREFNFGNYISSRIITCLTMIFICIIYIGLSGFTLEKARIIFWVSFIKMADAVEDIFHGQLQLNGKLDLAGKLLTIRNFVTILVFGLILIVTKNLYFTCMLTAIVSLGVCLIINISWTKGIERIYLCFDSKRLISLFTRCFPLFLASFLSIYIYNAPKYGIDAFLTKEAQTHYAIIFMPAFVINLLSEFIFKPILTMIAFYWNTDDFKKFNKIIRRLILSIILISVITIVAAKLCGIIILSAIYKVDLYGYTIELILLLIGGGLGAVVYLLFNVLSSIRSQKMILVGYFVGAVAATFLSRLLIPNYRLAGAAVSYILSEFIILLIFIFVLIYRVYEKRAVCSKV